MSHDVTILTEAELRAAVPLDLTAIDITERAFAALGGEGVVMPPIMSMELPGSHDEVDVKTAYLPGFASFAIKVSTGFYGNAELGLSSLNGLMTLFSTRTGLVEALLLDNGYLTDIRTAAAGAVAARHLAPAQVDCAGVLGTGLQARLQLQALHLVRPFRKAMVWGRSLDRAQACAADLAQALGVEVTAETDPALVVRSSQVVVTTTPSRAPILRADWLHPGLHITAMGSDAPEKNELEPAVLARADLCVVDRISQCASLGELRTALAGGALAETDVIELGRIVTGSSPGRTSAAQVTVCDLTGTGAQDTAIANHARDLLQGAGTIVRA
jgi:ornithine cyclodeaminase